jgi:hypothetical protein
MIDFRYHLISIVAVLLALSVGIVVGSGLLAGPLLQDLENRADRIRDRNQELLALADERLTLITEHERFALAAEPRLLGGVLVDTPVVVVTIEGSDDEVLDSLRASLSMAGAEVASTLRFTNKMAVSGSVDADLLALALSSTSGDVDELRLETADRVGAKFAAIASGVASRHLNPLLTRLEDGGFLEVDSVVEEEIVPSGAAFAVLAGSEGEPVFDAATFATEIAKALGSRGAGVVVTEPLGSDWGIISFLRGDSEARDSVTTSVGTESVVGRVSAVLGLALAIKGEDGHYGPESGSEVVIPQITPSD